jgi:hypothetical protein
LITLDLVCINGAKVLQACGLVSPATDDIHGLSFNGAPARHEEPPFSP